MSDILNHKISVIVPLYNRRQFISQCAASVMKQTDTDWELIIVDDGSTDHPEDVLAALQAQDSRVRVIKKQNGGVSTARNTGLGEATGTFIQFLDSDDTLSPDCLEKARKRMAECGADVVVYGMSMNGVSARSADVVPDSAVYHLPEQGKQMLQALHTASCLNAPVNKLWKRSVIAETRFRTEVSWGEDLIFNLETFPRCNTVCLLDRPLYRVTPGAPFSLSSRYDARGWDDMLAQRSALRQFGEEMGMDQESIRQLFDAYLWGCYRECTRKLSLTSALPYREVMQRLLRWNGAPEIAELKTTTHPTCVQDYVLRHQLLLPLAPLVLRLLHLMSCARRAARSILKKW